MEKAILREYTRDLRRNSTDTKKHLWYYLRANRLGHKFKRQVPIEGFIVDFVCFQKKLIIELDGGQHLIDHEKDNQRTAKLEACGFRVLRFWNHEVLQSTEVVLASIHKALSPNPLPAHNLSFLACLLLREREYSQGLKHSQTRNFIGNGYISKFQTFRRKISDTC